jgi:nucleoside-diphosphate-sugar epimerase
MISSSDLGTLCITGGAGHSGRPLLQKLSNAGYDGKIKLIARKREAYDFTHDLQLDCEICVGDIHDTAFMTETLKEVQTVLHIAGIHATRHLMKADPTNSVEWYILVHTTGRYSKYKSAAEEYISIEDGLLANRSNVTVLRPTMIYGSSRDRNMWKLVSFLGKYPLFPVFGNGRNLMQPVHALDLAQAYFDVLSRKSATLGKGYSLPGKTRIAYKDLLKTISGKLKKQTLYIHLPLSLSTAAARLAAKLTNGKFFISEEQVLRMNEDKVFDYSDAARDFGYSPMTFDAGIQIEIDEYMSGNTIY